MTTPYEKLKSLQNARQRLNPGMTVEQLDAIALRISDHEVVLAKRNTLFQSIAVASRLDRTTEH